jgi:hypothetical protein
MTPGLKSEVNRFLRAHGHPPILPVDVVLACLSIGTEEALKHVEQIMGRPITKCPSAMPPWPPKPVGESREPRITRIDWPKKTANGKAWPVNIATQVAKLKVGMTKEQIVRKHVSWRNASKWTGQGYIKWSSKP